MKITNNHQISLPIAVWLGQDDYNGYKKDEFYISATTLLKSVRQIVLSRRIQGEPIEVDVSDRLASRFGSSLHKSVEEAWVKGDYKRTLTELGYPEQVLDRIHINPKEDIPEGDIALYFELRTNKKVGKWEVSGEADMIFNGTVHDIKSTGTFAWTSNKNDEKYTLQMSIYAWLNPDKVNDPIGKIEFLFKDWSANKALSSDEYPKLPVMTRNLELLTHAEMEAWVKYKLSQVEKYLGSSEADLPECSDSDLWRDPPEYKYYGKPDATRATKNFKQDKAAAHAFMVSKGKGEVREVPSLAKACKYCNAAPICSQYQLLLEQGLIDGVKAT